MKLIIVESPTKANTFNRFLKAKEYHVEATMGHVRDLPVSKMGLDLEHGFAPAYKIAKNKAGIVNKIKQQAKKADAIILATDSDREGEAIAYHIAYLLGFIKENWPQSALSANGKLQRIVFHEITASALREALAHPQTLNLDLVNAQQARRILDRLVGYLLSPLLWKKMGKRWLSAGRVQTVALRFIVEREKEIGQFSKESFYKLWGFFAKAQEESSPELKAELLAKNEDKYEKSFSLNLFDGVYTYTKTTITAANVENLRTDLQSDSFTVSDHIASQNQRHPSAPFTTSTLQQEASRLFGYSSKMTMRFAQGLYERGLITYHRTDSVFLAEKFIQETRAFIEKKYGREFVPAERRIYKTKSKLAQEAHEAIRPTTMTLEIENLDIRHKRLYELIWRRAVASQMAPADIQTITLKITSGKGYLFQTKWEKLLFEGFLKLYPQITERLAASIPTGTIRQGDRIALRRLDCKETETSPPPRYNEASLIKTLEERGIGRPSTYAPIISTIQDRNYVEKRENRFYPTLLGTTVADYLSSAFAEIFKIDFTAHLEDDLDLIAAARQEMLSVLKTFYQPFLQLLQKAEQKTEHINIEEKTNEICPKCRQNLMIRYSRFGKFYGCSNYPKCAFTKSYYETVNKPCPQCGGQIIIRYTKRKRKFYGCANYPKCTFSAWKLS